VDGKPLEGNQSKLEGSSYFETSQRVQVAVTPFDSGDGESVESDEVIVGNTAPTVSDGSYSGLTSGALLMAWGDATCEGTAYLDVEGSSVSGDLTCELTDLGLNSNSTLTGTIADGAVAGDVLISGLVDGEAQEGTWEGVVGNGEITGSMEVSLSYSGRELTFSQSFEAE
jgi:hypothetical protein